jgi:hypothetical protein
MPFRVRIGTVRISRADQSGSNRGGYLLPIHIRYVQEGGKVWLAEFALRPVALDAGKTFHVYRRTH